MTQKERQYEMVALETVCNVLDNLRKPINSSERELRISGKPIDELFPYYGATGQVGWIDGYITDDDYILIGEDGAPFLDKYKPKAYLIKGKSWVNNHAHILKAKNGVSSNKFILYYLNSFNYHGFVNGTTRLKLTKGSLVSIPIPNPNLAEQNSIVSKLEVLFSELDKGIESLKVLQQQLKIYRQAVLKWAFEGRLTNDNVKDGELPEEWTLQPLSEIAKLVGGVTKGRKLDGKKTIYLPYLRVANVQDGYLDLSEMKEIEVLETDLEKYALLSGDVLYTEGGDKDKLGRGTVWQNQIPNCIHQNHVFRARLIENVLPKFVAYYSQTKSAKKYFYAHGKQTTNLASINLTVLSKLPIPICSKVEQQQIVQEIESRLSICDKIEETINNGLKEAESLRQSILKQAFEGKLI